MHHAALVSDDLFTASLPGAPSTLADDPSARGLLRRAQGAFQKWPEGFAGFRASVACDTPHGVVPAEVLVVPPGRVDVTCEDVALRAVLTDMLWGIAVDRTPRFFDEGDGRFPISFCDSGDDAATGRPINVHARLGQLRYWIDPAGRIRQVERIARGLRLVTRFEAFARATPGRVLPAQTTTSTWDLATGAVIVSEAIHDSHCRIDHVWLPAARHITMARSSVPIVLTLTDHSLL